LTSLNFITRLGSNNASDIFNEYTPLNYEDLGDKVTDSLQGIDQELAKKIGTKNIYYVPNSTSIQDIIDQAILDGYGAGGILQMNAVLLIAPGVYSENLTLHGGIDLVGLGPIDSVVISGQVNFTPNSLYNPWENKVKLQTITIYGETGNHAIYVDGTANGELQMLNSLCVKRGDTLTGVLIDNTNFVLNCKTCGFRREDTNGTVVEIMGGEIYMFDSFAGGIQGGDRALFLGAGSNAAIISTPIECVGNEAVYMEEGSSMNFSLSAIINNQVDGNGIVMEDNCTYIGGLSAYIMSGNGYTVTGTSLSTFIYGVTLYQPGGNKKVDANIGLIIPFTTSPNII
jgi:hypothetical protein